IVEALDAVAAMDQLDIDGMQEEDVKNFRFQRHTPDIRAISNVAFAVKAELHSLPNWTNGYFRAALSLINRGAFPRPAERGIATRFLLAAARLSRGGSMYNEKTDSFDFKPSQKPAFPI
ncbi:MAG: hypothetical protein JWO78_1209, partial [Micavibrio sp.]|nr:hypothetical protein [Micavibrio sp.]